MKKLCKCHLFYSFSKVTIVLIATLLIVLVIAFLMTAIYSNETHDLLLTSKLYFDNCFNLLQPIIMLLAVFMFSYPYLSSQNQYSYYLIARQEKRSTVFISKIFVSFIIIFLIFVICLVMSIVIGNILIDYFFIPNEIITKYFNCFIQSTFFGLFALLFTQLFDSVYVIVFVLSLSFVCKGFALSKQLIGLLLCQYDEYGFYHFSYFFIVLYLIMFLIANIGYFIYADLK